MAKGKYEYWLTAEGLLQLEAWARNGLTDEQIAENIGISRSTLNDWKNKYSDISDTLKNNKLIIDTRVENALFKKAIGFVGPDKKYYPPDTTAQIFWLKNRKPEDWRDKKDVSVEGDINSVVSSMSEEALDERIASLKIKLGIDDEQIG